MTDARTTRVILIAGWCAFIIHAYPGVMDPNAFAQLAQARSGVIADPSPVAVMLWSVSDHIIAGPFGLLAAASLMFLAGAFLIARRLVSSRCAAIVAVVTLLFPPVLAGVTIAGSYGLFTGAAQLGAALMLSRCRIARGAGLGLLSLAGALVDGGWLATLPLVLLLATGLSGEAWKRRGIALGLWLVTLIVGAVANAGLADHDVAPLAVADIAGTLAKAPDLDPKATRDILLDGGLLDRDPQGFSRAHYTPAGLDAPLVVATTPAQIRALERARRALAFDHSGAYLEHRLAMLEAVLDGAPIANRNTQPSEPLRAAEIPTGHSKLQGATNRVIELASPTPLFSPWLYAVLALALLYRLREIRPLYTLLASGLAMELAALYWAFDDNFMRSHWLITCAVLVTGITVAGAARPAD